MVAVRRVFVTAATLRAAWRNSDWSQPDGGHPGSGLTEARGGVDPRLAPP